MVSYFDVGRMRLFSASLGKFLQQLLITNFMWAKLFYTRLHDLHKYLPALDLKLIFGTFHK